MERDELHRPARVAVVRVVEDARVAVRVRGVVIHQLEVEDPLDLQLRTHDEFTGRG
jgi:hypothetical protein